MLRPRASTSPRRPAETVEVLRRLPELRELGRPLLLAVSRKDFVGALTGRRPAARDAGTLAAVGRGRRRRREHPARARRGRGARLPGGARGARGERRGAASCSLGPGAAAGSRRERAASRSPSSPTSTAARRTSCPSLLERAIEEINELQPGRRGRHRRPDHRRPARRVPARARVPRPDRLRAHDRGPGQPRLAQRRLRALRGAVRRAPLGAAQGRRVDRGRRLHRARPRPRPDRPRPLRVDRGALRRATRPYLRIFVLHHHLLPVPGTGRERNIVYDAGDMLECLLRAGVHLVLSGHKHVPYAWRLENLFVVNAGTVSTMRLRGKTQALLQRDRGEPGAGHGVPQVPVPRAGRDHRVRPADVRVREGPVAARRDRRTAERVARHRADRRRAPPARRCATRSTRLEPGRRGRSAAARRRSAAGAARRALRARRSRPIRRTALRRAGAAAPTAVVDLADEPVLPPSAQAARWRRSRCTWGCATRRRACGSTRPRYAPVAFDGPEAGRDRHRQAHRQDRGGRPLGRAAARARGDPVIVCMGRGGPAEPTRGRGRHRARRSCSRSSRAGGHAASDYLEDAVLAGVRTVGCRRVGGGLAGEPWRVERARQGAALAASLPGAGR